MTLQVPKSQIGDNDFAALVAAHVAELAGHAAHMARVQEDDARAAALAQTGPKGKADEQFLADREAKFTHQPYPAPIAHPMVDGAVRRDADAGGKVTFTPDYVVVDDTPSAAELLRTKKNNLMGRVTALEQAAMAAVVPIGKVRLFHLMEGDVIKADVARREQVQAKKKDAAPADIQNEVIKGRPATDAQFMAAQAARRERLARIARTAAQMHHDIEDLTSDTVDAWQPLSFE
jgi:predicted XRE-type DNA-binding protein